MFNSCAHRSWQACLSAWHRRARCGRLQSLSADVNRLTITRLRYAFALPNRRSSWSDYDGPHRMFTRPAAHVDTVQVRRRFVACARELSPRIYARFRRRTLAAYTSYADNVRLTRDLSRSWMRTHPAKALPGARLPALGTRDCRTFLITYRCRPYMLADSGGRAARFFTPTSVPPVARLHGHPRAPERLGRADHPARDVLADMGCYSRQPPFFGDRRSRIRDGWPSIPRRGSVFSWQRQHNPHRLRPDERFEECDSSAGRNAREIDDREPA